LRKKTPSSVRSAEEGEIACRGAAFKGRPKKGKKRPPRLFREEGSVASDNKSLFIVKKGERGAAGEKEASRSPLT